MTDERIGILKEADFIVRGWVKAHSESLPDIWQFPVVVFPLGYGDDEAIALRPVESTDAMTAKFATIRKDLLSKLAAQLLELPGISSVLYDITNKPPATIEWE